MNVSRVIRTSLAISAVSLLFFFTQNFSQLSGVSVTQSVQVVQKTVATDALCTGLGNFYWEVGNSTNVLGSGSIGTAYTSSTSLEIHSASKWVFGAYVIQANNNSLSAQEILAMHLMSGYSGLSASCSGMANVDTCLKLPNSTNGSSPPANYVYKAANLNKFYYDGAPDQMLADMTVANGGLGLALATPSQLTSLIAAALGNPGFKYGAPELAAGMVSTPSQYGLFLRNILAHKLLIYNDLGVDPICTLPGTACPTAVSSPIPVAWHYSYNHWIEDDPTGDGAFSSLGIQGFYPWISADKTLYGIVARQDTVDKGAGYKTAECGRKIRTAWITGVAD
jgi:hypothetical protein